MREMVVAFGGDCFLGKGSLGESRENDEIVWAGSACWAGGAWRGQGRCGWPRGVRGGQFRKQKQVKRMGNKCASSKLRRWDGDN